jgi:hypothetical protein
MDGKSFKVNTRSTSLATIFNFSFLLRCDMAELSKSVAQQSMTVSKADAALQSKLKNVEAQRILAVVQEIQRKMSLMALLPERVDGRFAMVFGEQFSTQMAVSWLVSFSLLIDVFRNIAS